MKNSILILTACAALTCCTEPQVSTVHLKGQLIDMGTTQVPMHYDGAESMIGDSRDIVLNTDKEGRFDTILTIKEPTYYNIVRNTLYLTPGDDMTVKITQNNEEGEFSGKGAEVNNYMKYRLFPKGGSYLNGGSTMSKTFEETKVLIDSMAQDRRSQLASLKEATPAFKRLEGARITADVVNSYLKFASYAMSYYRDLQSRETYMQIYDSLYQRALPEAIPFMKDLMGDDLLNVAVVRDIMYSVVQPETEEDKKLSEGLQITPFMKEAYKAANYVNKMRREVSQELFDEVNTYMNTMQYPACKAELNEKIAQASKLMKGEPAIDFVLTDKDGKSYKLSDFKGKILYLDFWATWCGACIEESPYFEKLAKEFEGKDIVFIPVSTDSSKKSWLSYLNVHKKDLTQYNTIDRALTTDWAMHYIPRFIVIDENFKIVNAYAPRPSQPEAKELLESLLK